jgi:hypothetical protein
MNPEIANNVEDIQLQSNLAQAKIHLGREFLQWCWFISETETEGMELSIAGNQHQIEVWLDERVVFESTKDGGEIMTQKGGEPAMSPETTAAMLSGKSLREARVGIRHQSGIEWICVVDSRDLNPKGLRIVRLADDGSETSVDQDGLVEKRLDDIQMFIDVFDALFSRFVQIRLAGDWKDETVASMRQWMRKRTVKHLRH